MPRGRQEKLPPTRRRPASRLAHQQRRVQIDDKGLHQIPTKLTMATNRMYTLLAWFLSSQQIVAFTSIPQSSARRRQATQYSTVLARSKSSGKGPDDFFSLYDEEELRNILNIHRQLTNDEESGDAAVSPPAEESPIAMSIHESLMRSQGEDTMKNLLDLHESLKKGETDKAIEQREQLLNSASSRQNDDAVIPPSLHDLIQEAVGAPVDKVDRNGKSDVPVVETMKWDDETLKKIDNVRAIASDVDGTLLTSQQTIHPRTRQAVLRAMGSPKHFFVATGKSRKGAFNSLGVEMATLLKNVPGVFLQGLYTVDGEGNVVFEQKLTKGAIKAVEQLAAECNVNLVAYDGDSLYSTGMSDAVRSLSERYGEPTVKLLPMPLSEYENGFHKILLADENVDMLKTIVRPKLDALAEENAATVTQAMPTMLEWLPEGCSKAVGVSKLCEALGIDPTTELLAMGDAENDLDMLKMASIGVAVGNASPVAREAADFLMEETNNEGGAGAAMETFGFGKTNV